MSKAIAEKLREAQVWKDLAKRYEAQRVDANKHAEKALRDAKTLMEGADLSLVRFEGQDGLNFTASTSTRRNAKITDHEEFEHWCQLEGLDPNDFKAYHSRKVSSFYKERMETDESLPLGVEVSEFEQLVIKKGAN